MEQGGGGVMVIHIAQTPQSKTVSFSVMDLGISISPQVQAIQERHTAPLLPDFTAKDSAFPMILQLVLIT